MGYSYRSQFVCGVALQMDGFPEVTMRESLGGSIKCMLANGTAVAVLEEEADDLRVETVELPTRNGWVKRMDLLIESLPD